MPPTKAASLVFAAFSKVDEQEDGTLKVYGIASTESVDSAGEIVKANAIRAALPDYLSFGAIREMHQPIAAGTALACSVDDEGVTHLAAHIVDASSCLKVQTGVLKGFSIGGRVTKRNATSKHIIEGIKLTEISLVDRPANPDAMISLAKIDSSGKMTMSEPVAKVASASLAKSMYDVGLLAELIQRLHALMCWSQDEANWEGDASGIPAKLKANVESLCETLRDMVDEETRELLGIADQIVLADVAAKADALTKKGAKFSKATVGVLAMVHKAMKDSDALMESIGYLKADNQDSEDDEMTDAEKAELTKAQARVVELEASNAALTASVAANTDAITKATKAADDATAAAKTATDTLEKMAAGVADLLEKKKGTLVVVPRTPVTEELAKGADGKPTFAALMRESHAKPLLPLSRIAR